MGEGTSWSLDGQAEMALAPYQHCEVLIWRRCLPWLVTMLFSRQKSNKSRAMRWRERTMTKMLLARGIEFARLLVKRWLGALRASAWSRGKREQGSGWEVSAMVLFTRQERGSRNRSSSILLYLFICKILFMDVSNTPLHLTMSADVARILIDRGANVHA